MGNVSRKGAKVSQRRNEGSRARQVVNDASDAVLDQVDVEVDQEAEMSVAQAEIGQELFLVDGGDRFDRFDLDDYPSLNQKVEAEPLWRWILS